MTREGFAYVARILRRTKPLLRTNYTNPEKTVYDNKLELWYQVCLNFLVDFDLRYPRFNRERFKKACGMFEEDEHE